MMTCYKYVSLWQGCRIWCLWTWRESYNRDRHGNVNCWGIMFLTCLSHSACVWQGDARSDVCRHEARTTETGLGTWTVEALCFWLVCLSVRACDREMPDLMSADMKRELQRQAWERELLRHYVFDLSVSLCVRVTGRCQIWCLQTWSENYRDRLGNVNCWGIMFLTCLSKCACVWQGDARSDVCGHEARTTETGMGTWGWGSNVSTCWSCPLHRRALQRSDATKWFLFGCCVRHLPSVLWLCWLGGRKGIRPVKIWVIGCWHSFLSGARCRLAYSPADATATHCLLLQ